MKLSGKCCECHRDAMRRLGGRSYCIECYELCVPMRARLPPVGSRRPSKPRSDTLYDGDPFER